MRCYFHDAAERWMTETAEPQRRELVQGKILPLLGHHKVSGFGQFQLEDARQRFSRSGVSPKAFRSEYLPAIRGLLAAAAAITY